ncbi:MAG TPA: hypothetical protein VJC16_00770 [Candidatus Nanoarchaeia archaeon]|nr:hypothetical protein [Candidatus Nanoarchaeia archaeon]
MDKSLCNQIIRRTALIAASIGLGMSLGSPHPALGFLIAFPVNCIVGLGFGLFCTLKYQQLSLPCSLYSGAAFGAAFVLSFMLPVLLSSEISFGIYMVSVLNLGVPIGLAFWLAFMLGSGLAGAAGCIIRYSSRMMSR